MTNIKSFICALEGKRASRNILVGVVFGPLYCSLESPLIYLGWFSVSLLVQVRNSLADDWYGVQTFLKKMMPSFAAASLNSIFLDQWKTTPLDQYARAGTKFGAWLDRTRLSAKLNLPIFLVSLIEANPPNLIFPAILYLI